MPSLNRLFARLTSREVVARAQVGTTKKLFELAGSLLDKEQPQAASLFQLLLSQREKLGSTALGAGVALPHALTPKIDTPKIALITLDHPIPFDAPDLEPVDIFLCVILPENNSTIDPEHVLQQLTKMIKNVSLLEAMRDSQTNQELYHSLLMVTVLEDA